jgi:pyocin large subunit-like protein
MSHEAVDWALHRAPMPVTETGRPDSTARFVLVDLADHANAKALTWPGIVHLRHATGFDERTVQRALRRLEAAGLIRRDGKHRSGATRWKLDLTRERPASELAELEAEAEETKRRESAKRKARRHAQAAPVSGTENPGHGPDVRHGESRRPALSVPESGTENPGVRHGVPPEPSGTVNEPSGTVTGGHAAPRAPLREDDPPSSDRLTGKSASPLVGGSDQSDSASNHPHARAHERAHAHANAREDADRPRLEVIADAS